MEMPCFFNDPQRDQHVFTDIYIHTTHFQRTSVRIPEYWPRKWLAAQHREV
ncbi:hypothetical protein CCACVL1_10724 [Corchorus capsularis]|uniref:Uncharacterized protein n=1 Tax=Corchorus capsularis TaxID=210143 RepID=A0A1R3IQ11_COCAP|nr:hypothetical protein CCACVL1_10724 [Corchorus capsularis]